QNIREKNNEDYLASYHDIDPDNVDIIDDYHSEISGFFYGRVVEGDNEHYMALLNYIMNHDLNDDTAAEYVKTQMKVDNYLDYMAAQIYFANFDGPGHNCKFWRPKKPGGRYRWLLYDTDAGFCANLPGKGYSPSAYMHNTLAFYNEGDREGWPNDWRYTIIFYNLLKNEGIRNSFINRFSDYLNTVFTQEVVTQKIIDIKTAIEPEIPYHFDRWNGSTWTVITTQVNTFSRTVSQWNDDVQIMLNFAERRVNYVRDHIQNEFNLNGKAKVNFTISQPNTGKIKINTLVIDDFPWEGTYFQGVPVQIIALPNPGYRFAGWTGITPSDSANTMVSLTDNTSITAVFEEDTSSQINIVINEINYNSSADFNPEDWVEFYNPQENSVDLSGWIFKDDNDANEFVFPSKTVIAPDDYLVLCRDSLTFHDLFPEVDDYIGDLGFGLSGAGEFIRLFNAQGALVDSLTYDDNPPWPVEPDGTGAALALLNPGLDNSLVQSWAVSYSHGTPGKINDVFIVNVDDSNSGIPTVFSLGQNYPNPFNPITTIPFSIPEVSRITIDIYSILGQRVETLLDEYLAPGNHSIIFKAEDIAAGVYFYTITSEKFRETRQMLLIK
ncbi:CotH kinase family protein, partial [Candidatus Latescibacterota bacterium]